MNFKGLEIYVLEELDRAKHARWIPRLEEFNDVINERMQIEFRNQILCDELTAQTCATLSEIFVRNIVRNVYVTALSPFEHISVDFLFQLENSITRNAT